MRRILGLAALVGVLVLGGYFGASLLLGVPELAPSLAPIDAPAPTVPVDAIDATVAYVHDGDTLYLQPSGTFTREEQLTVRLIGVDAPELRPEPTCLATEARDFLRTLLPQGAAVRTVAGVEPLDRYGRALLYVWADDGTFVNRELVARGYAAAVRIGANDAYWPELVVAQSAAQDADEGLWGAC